MILANFRKPRVFNIIVYLNTSLVNSLSLFYYPSLNLADKTKAMWYVVMLYQLNDGMK